MSGIRTEATQMVIQANGVDGLKVKETGVCTAGAAGVSGLDVCTMGQVPFTKYYNGSGELAIGSAFGYTLPHSLGAAPTLMRTTLICKIAEGGYAIGDVLEVPMGCDLTDTGAFTRGTSVTSDAVNIYVRCIANTSVFAIINKTTGALLSATSANWRLIVRAWA